MNVETRTVAVQYPEKEYINGIFVSVQGPLTIETLDAFLCRAFRQRIPPSPPPFCRSGEAKVLERQLIS
jgi:hypothetical protein